MSRAPRKKSSNYHSPLRAKQAAETRRSVLAAALELFGAHGWAGTTLAMIAARAGVSVDTIHVIFRTKSALLLEVFEVAIVGDDDEARMADRPEFAELGRGRRPDRVRAGVRYTITTYERSISIVDTLREAAASDELAHARLKRFNQDRHDLAAAALTLILGHEPTPDVVDAVWTLLGPGVYTDLIIDRGWSPSEVEDWLVDLMQIALKTQRR
jgi:AcrR family transcriptional regulator